MAISRTQFGWMALGGMVCLFGLSLYSITRDNSVSAQDSVTQKQKEANPLALVQATEPAKPGTTDPVAPPLPSTALVEPIKAPVKSPIDEMDKKEESIDLAVAKAVGELTGKVEEPARKKQEEPKKVAEELVPPPVVPGLVPPAAKQEEEKKTEPQPTIKGPLPLDEKSLVVSPELKPTVPVAEPKAAPAVVAPLPVPEPIGPSTTPATPLAPFVPGGVNQVPVQGVTPQPTVNNGPTKPQGVTSLELKSEVKTTEFRNEGEPPLAPRPGPVQSYHVRHDGETVRDIARKTLGSVDRWEDIVKLNPNMKPDGALTEGLLVRLPAEACFPTNEVDIVKPLPVLRKPSAARARVLPLTGTFPCNLDEKRTIALPKSIRDQLGNCETVMVSPGPDQCLWLTNQAHLDRLAERLENSPAREVEVRVFKRLYYAQTERVTVNGDGHIQISDRLAQFAGLDSEVVLVGIDDHFELWDVARWKQYTQTQSSGARAVSADQ